MENKRPIGIIGAMGVEVRALLDAMEETGQERFAGLVFHVGALSGAPCVIAQCGEGKVNAAVCAQTMILQYAPRLVINVGVAGGVGLNIGDLVVASACVQHDFDATPMGYPLGNLFLYRDEGEPEQRIELPADGAAAALLLEEAQAIYGGAYSGIVATGDQFVADKAKNQWLHETFGAKAVEMEGGSIAQVCYMNRTPFAVLRAISDNADGGSPVDFPAFTQECAAKTARLLTQALGRL